MAIGMAQNGGLGILHRYMSVEDQVEQVRKVKRTEAFVNTKPYLVGQGWSIEQVREQMDLLGVKSFLVTDDVPFDYNKSMKKTFNILDSPIRRKNSEKSERCKACHSYPHL